MKKWQSEGARRGRRAFSLVEMLVVIVIIGILAAILVPVTGQAIRSAKRTAIVTEMSDLSRAIEAYKLDRKGYFPDFTNWQAVIVHLQRSFPRNNFNLNSWVNPSQAPATRHPRDLDAAEALVFWLSLTKNNPRNPITGQGENKVYYDFKAEQLTDLDGDGWPEYVSKHATGAPYVYFDGRSLPVTGGTAPNIGPAYAYAWAVYPSPYGSSAGPAPFSLARDLTTLPGAGTNPSVGVVRPYRSSIMAADSKAWPLDTASNTRQWIEPGKFQIIHPGLDNHFGFESMDNNVLRYKTFPALNYYVDGTTLTEDFDNLTSFSDGRTIGDSVP
jgi:prepilin-type N-terminal cleavage/methylation domain-containing protein